VWLKFSVIQLLAGKKQSTRIYHCHINRLMSYCFRIALYFGIIHVNEGSVHATAVVINMFIRNVG
jgi:hypothetical protein